MKKKLKTLKSSAPPSAEMKRLEEVFRLMGAFGVGEVELEDKNGRIHVRMPSMGVAMAAPSAVPASTITAPVVQSAPAAALSSEPVTSAPLAANQKKITSPFVGTFYRASNPNSAPYAKEGQVVRKGQTLCIIEAMKLMNEIESEFDGKIVSVLAENGQPVEFGEALFIVEV